MSLSLKLNLAPRLAREDISLYTNFSISELALQGITFVNEYALMRTLGKGSFGKVKLAMNTLDHELYGLKLIPKSRRRRRGTPDGSPQFAEADVMQEIDVMKQLSHPNIVRLVEVIGESLQRSKTKCSKHSILSP